MQNLDTRYKSHREFLGSNKIACVYHYFEANDDHRENLKYFLENALVPDVDFYIVIAGEISLNINEDVNLKVLFVENISFDIGGYQFGYQVASNIQDYEYMFFLNSGVLGPLIPSHDSEGWHQKFINKFTEHKKIVGTTVHFPKPDYRKDFQVRKKESNFGYSFNDIILTHVPSMFLCISREALKFLEKSGIFTKFPGREKIEIVLNFEIAVSQLVLNNGWDLGCIQPEFDNFDFRVLKQNPNESSWNGDSYFPNAYFGKTINPYNVIFFKTTRNLMDSQQLKDLRNGVISISRKTFSQKVVGKIKFKFKHFKLTILKKISC